MTLWPTEDRQVIDRPDLPEYELNEICGSPLCDHATAHNHHLFRKGRQGTTKSWWVELSDGTVLANRLGLCFTCHEDVTGSIGGHKARIVWDTNLSQYLWQSNGDAKPLSPHPPLSSSLGLEVLASPPEPEAGTERNDSILEAAEPPVSLSERVGIEKASDALVPGKVDASPRSESDTSSEEVAERAWQPSGEHNPSASSDSTPGPNHSDTGDGIGPGNICPTCDRRVPHVKKESSPKSTKQLNVGHGPADSVERVKERLNDLAETAGLSELPYGRLKTVDLLLILGAAVAPETLREYAATIDKELGWAS